MATTAVTSDVNTQSIHATFSYGVIYIYSIPGEQHTGRLKIGSATVNSPNPTQEEIEQAAHDRIRQQTKTADVRYHLEYATLALTDDHNYLSDYTVHEVLKRSGYERQSENVKNSHSEWFRVDLVTAKNAIQAAKEGRAALNSNEMLKDIAQHFDFRPNQLAAIEQTNKAIKQHRKHFLWNAKMRFGKTSTAMEVARQNDFKKVLIVTHRPSVSTDWYDDFQQVFAGTDYQFSSKTKGEELRVRLNQVYPFVYFASLQDLRLSEAVVSDGASKSHAKGFKKNNEIFETTWDMLIIDEAHEGTQSNLGDTTFSKIKANFTLELSGTPFNILHKHEENDIYTWDYVMEQRDKLNWDEEHPGTPNPYAELPALEMFTYDIDTVASHVGSLDAYMDALDGAFKFHEFFRVHRDAENNETAQFVHEPMVNKFLDLLVNDQIDTKFPYATSEYRGYIKHSLWLLPNRTKVIEAMEKLLKNHPVFSKFAIVNISGTNTDEEADNDAKKRVRHAIDTNEYTITLTGQRLTTGASIPEWTAVFMLSDTNSATTYLQTAFRCQTPAKIDGMLKTQGYVFDFAPDRTLKLVAEAVELNHKSGSVTTTEQKQAMREFLNFCPIIAAEGGGMHRYDVSSMLEQLKRAVIERVSRNGFDDPKLYNDELMKLNELDLENFKNLREIVGAATSETINEIEVNALGMTDLQREKAEEIERKKKQKKELTDEEKELRQKLKEAREQKKSAISVLRGVSIRMPMLVYGANVSYQQDISLDDFINLVDNESWAEFMPAGLTKDQFREFTKYYDQDVFKGVTRNIRAKAFDCDDLLPADRIQAIAEIFATFKNPDKETVLTPWNVVNLQFAATLGGADFASGVVGKNGKPEWKTRGNATRIWSDDTTKILEINSKSGLYPLLAAYDIYDRQLIKHKESEDKISSKIWRDVLANNIYVLCKSPMAATITRRTLAGYTGARMNIAYIHDLVPKLRGEGVYKGYTIESDLRKQFGIGENEVKFTAVVGNPPYQVMNENNKMSRSIYPLFVEESVKLGNLVSLVMPARWMSGEDGPYKETSGFVGKMKGYGIEKFTLYPNSQDLFKGVDIKGGVCFFLLNPKHKGNTDYTLVEYGESHEQNVEFYNKLDDNIIIRYPELISIVEKIDFRAAGANFKESFASLKTLVSSRNPYGFISDLFTKNNEKVERISEVRQRDDDWEIIGLLKGKRVRRFIPHDALKKNIEGAMSYKVLVPRANGSGVFGEIFSTPMLGAPMLGAPMLIGTDTFLEVGKFDNAYEAESLLKYVKTKFFRAMVGVKKTAVFNYKDAFTFVPIQDFTEKSDIDWSGPIADIDRQLYTRYHLDEKEINFIETRVRAME